MTDVFISFSPKDSEVAEALNHALERHGLNVFSDYFLTTGEDFDERIFSELKEASFIVIILSKHSERNKWVGIRLQEALTDSNKNVIQSSKESIVYLY